MGWNGRLVLDVKEQSPGSVDTLPTPAQKAAMEHQELIDRLKNKATKE